MATDNKGYTFEENIVLTNEELTSNVSKLASFIRSYEGGEWKDVQTKASQLLNDKKAFEYIDSIRARAKAGEPPKPQIKSSKRAPLPNPNLEVFKLNFTLLEEIAPDLEELLSSEPFKSIHGKSVKTGYSDLYMDCVDSDKTGYYILLAQFRTYGGETISDPEMELLVNFKNKTVEALNHEDATRYAEVYPDKHDRKIVNTEEQKSQNEFLTDWLKKLDKHGHEIEWKSKANSKKSNSSENLEEQDSMIVDEFQKGKTQKDKSDSKKEPQRSTNSPSEKQRIETLFGDISVSDGKKCLKQLEKVILFKEGNTLPPDKVESRVNALVKDGSIAPFLFDAIEKLLTLDGGHLMSLNYYKFLDIIPNLIEKLADENASVQLKSTKSELVYTVKFANRLLANVVTYAIYEQNEQKKENATMLIKVRTKDKFAIVDHISGNFFDLETYAPDELDPFQNEYYFASLGLNQWLITLVKGDFFAEWSEPIEMEQEPELKIEFHPIEEGEESDKYDNDYINKDIPDFEPGHVQLTETHIKHHVTQKVIDRINETKKGVVIFPRSQKMIYNTKDKKADLAQQAQMPGFRLSKTGKFYYEGRSNRADRTRTGY